MKVKKIERKLNLKKQTITNLGKMELSAARGGILTDTKMGVLCSATFFPGCSVDYCISVNNFTCGIMIP